MSGFRGVPSTREDFTTPLPDVQVRATPIDPTPAVIVPKGRSIIPMGQAAITATAWIEEQHRDELVITEHPVETGAAVSDHAYKRPAECTIRVGWAPGGPNNFDILAIYDQLRKLQADRILFDLYTGKQHYINMLFATLGVVTDEHNENVLIIMGLCKQVLLVNTSTTTAPTPSANPAQQANPQTTAAPADKGTVVLNQAPNYNPAGVGVAGIQGLPGSPSGPSVPAPGG
jgi:hypothetical protein